MIPVSIEISEFEQGGFYVNNGADYSSSLEIRSGLYEMLPAQFTVSCGGYQWSFICFDENRQFRFIQAAFNYKDSGTEIDLSAFRWVRYIRIELHSDSGIAPPAACTVDYSVRWHKDGSGRITNSELLPRKVTAPIVKPYPAALWRCDPNVNGGKPWHELLPGLKKLNIWAMEPKNIISVYDMNEPQTGFDHNGLAILEPTECTSECELNERWDITLVHPLDKWGKWKNLIVQNVLRIGGQLFRIDEQYVYMDGSQAYISVHAKHIWYDLADVLVVNASATGQGGNWYINCLFYNRVKNSEGFREYTFTGYSSMTGTVRADVKASSVAAALIGDDNCLINQLGGYLYRDNFYFSINSYMEHSDQQAFSLRYSADMTRISQRIDYSELVTHLICEDNFGNWFAVSQTPGSGWFVHHQKTKKVFFNYSENEPETLKEDGMAYWETVNKPKITYEIEIANIKNDPKYAGFLDLQNYRVGDGGYIYCEPLQIETSQRITGIKRNELLGEVISITLGNKNESIIRKKYKANTITTEVSALQKQLEVLRSVLMTMNISGMEQFPVSALETRSINILEGR